MMVSAPAAAKAAMNGSTGEIIRCTSKAASCATQRLHHIGPDRQIGHEVAVHHVDMDVVGAGVVTASTFGRARRSRRRGSTARCACCAAWR